MSLSLEMDGSRTLGSYLSQCEFRSLHLLFGMPSWWVSFEKRLAIPYLGWNVNVTCASTCRLKSSICVYMKISLKERKSSWWVVLNIDKVELIQIHMTFGAYFTAFDGLRKCLFFILYLILSPESVRQLSDTFFSSTGSGNGISVRLRTLS